MDSEEQEIEFDFIMDKGEYAQIIIDENRYIRKIDLEQIQDYQQQRLLKSTLKSVRDKGRHPNVQQITQVYKDQNSLIVISQYFEESLQDRLERIQKFGQQQALDIFQQIIAGYNFIKDQTYKHDKIELNNIFITSDETIKIANFSLKSFWKNKQDEDRNLLIKRQIFQNIDVWSFGIILYLLIFGKKPWKGQTKTQPQLLQNIRKLSLNLDFVKMSPQTKQLLSKMLCKNPKKRMRMAELLKLFSSGRFKKQNQKEVMTIRYTITRSGLFNRQIFASQQIPRQQNDDNILTIRQIITGNGLSELYKGPVFTSQHLSVGNQNADNGPITIRQLLTPSWLHNGPLSVSQSIDSSERNQANQTIIRELQQQQQQRQPSVAESNQVQRVDGSSDQIRQTIVRKLRYLDQIFHNQNQNQNQNQNYRQQRN